MKDIYYEKMLNKLGGTVLLSTAISDNERNSLETAVSITDYSGLDDKQRLVRLMIGDLFIKNFKIINENDLLKNWENNKYNLDKYFSYIAHSNHSFHNFARDLIDV